MGMTGQERPFRKPDYELEEIDGELLIYHVADAQVFRANQTAALIWQLCSGELTVDEIVSMLEEAFPNATTVPNDVNQTLDALRELGAIEVR
ncbi:MAG: PqqD family protein [Polyangiales bacterium]